MKLLDARKDLMPEGRHEVTITDVRFSESKNGKRMFQVTVQNPANQVMRINFGLKGIGLDGIIRLAQDSGLNEDEIAELDDQIETTFRPMVGKRLIVIVGHNSAGYREVVEHIRSEITGPAELSF